MEIWARNSQTIEARQLRSSLLLQPRSSSRKRRWPNTCHYWKAIFTVFFAGAVLVAIVLLSLYYTRWRGGGREDAGTEPEN